MFLSYFFALRNTVRNVVLFFTLFVFAINVYAQETAFPATLPSIPYHLTARPWQPLNIPADAYLDRVEGIVREVVKFQNAQGAIIDPYAGREVQYSTPYFAFAIGTLVSAGRAADLLDNGIAAMNNATAAIAAGRKAIADDHGEFFLAPLAKAILLYEPHVPAAQVLTWKTRMANPVSKVTKGLLHNWRTYGMKGEWYRAKNGYVNSVNAVKWIEDSWLKTQKRRIVNNDWNFYHDESSNPDTWQYEAAARGNLLSIIADGYDGASRNEMAGMLKKATQFSLLLQDPSGQSTAGGRSGNHTWNDIVMANGFETAAEMAYQEGNARLAGQYRRAAALGFQSAQRWRRADGTYSVTKNHFDPKNRTGYAHYSYLTNYNGYMMFHMAENYLRHKSAIPEQAAPNEIGGYTLVTDSMLATAVANAGGMHMQVNLRGAEEQSYGPYWTTLGVVRFGRPGWDTRLGPSDGVRETAYDLGISFAPTFPEGSKWLRLGSIPDRYEASFSTQFAHPLLVRCRVVYKPKKGKTGATYTNDFVITPDGILSTLTATTANYGVTWPLLTHDGTVQLNTKISSHIGSTSFPGGTDEQHFIALHDAPLITTTDSTRRSSYGDLRPVRMISGTNTNLTFIYPRSTGDPAAADVHSSFKQSGKDFSSVLGSVTDNIYIGRTSAGGEGKSIDLNGDGAFEVQFDTTTGFILQLQDSVIKRIETDRDVTAVIAGQTYNLQAYMPADIIEAPKAIPKVLASTDDGNVAANTLDKDFNTRWAAKDSNQWIRYYLDTLTRIKAVNIAWHRGNERKTSFEIQTSPDSVNWKKEFSGQSSGNTNALESYSFTATEALYVKIIGYGNNVDGWNAITEIEFVKDSIVTDTTGPIDTVPNPNPNPGPAPNPIPIPNPNPVPEPDTIAVTSLTIWPNPNPGLLHVQATEEWSNAEIEIYTLAGNLVSKTKMTGVSARINMNNQPRGIYLIRAVKNGKTLIRKMIR